MRIGVVTFPGSNSDVDSLNALAVAGVEPVSLWHESPDLKGVSAVILPGGFAYGDYIRAGVIARFSPVMGGVKEFAAAGGLVLGICNGFQVLAEAGLVPGALLRNRSLRFAGRLVNIKPDRLDSPFTRSATGAPMRVPVAHGEGCYYADDATLDELERERPGALPVRPRRRHARARSRRAGQPERLAARDRRCLQRGRQRGRADAASGADVRGDLGDGRRHAGCPIAGRERERVGGGRTSRP